MTQTVTQSNTLQTIVAITYITKDNARFEKENDFIKLTLTAQNDEGVVETKEYPRIFLHRVFPFDHPYSYISVLDKEQKEIGLISDVDTFDDKVKEMLHAELDRKYYTPVITRILSLKDKYGYSYWKVETDEGELTFTLRDTFHSLLKVHNTRIFVNDIDGNRYEIPDVEKLDRKSYKKIELFL